MKTVARVLMRTPKEQRTELWLSTAVTVQHTSEERKGKNLKAHKKLNGTMANQDEMHFAAIIVTALFTLLFLPQAVNLAAANPINPPLINVYSPQNGRIYPVGEVQLNFTIVPNELVTFTSATYSLDGKPEQATNGSTTLTRLAAGSHKLTVYGKGTYSISGQTHQYNSVEEVIYFSVQYSTAWVTFTVALAIAVSSVTILLLLTRRQIVSALRGKKTGKFWAGLALFLFFFCIFFVPSLWVMSTDYLFPHYSRGIVVAVPWGFTVTATLVFMGIGIALMKLGSKGSQRIEAEAKG